MPTFRGLIRHCLRAACSLRLEEPFRVSSKNAVLAAFICLTAFTWCSPQVGQSDHYLARLEGSQAEMFSHGTTGGLCAVVWPDGRLHAERRTQTLPSTRATLQSYDTVLDAREMETLRQLLNSEPVQQLPPFRAARTQDPVAAAYGFTADISRPGQLQHAGFEQLGRNGGNGSNPIDRKDARPSDEQSRVVLQPLMEWMESTVARTQPNPGGEVNFCSVKERLSNDQTGKNPQAEALVREIMAADLSRCHDSINGVERISFVPSTDAEIAQIRSLGIEAIPPLAAYLDIAPKDGFTQLFAVRFLADIGGSATFAPLKRAFAPDQWEVTRFVALDAMFEVSRARAEPYIKLSLADQSSLVRKRAKELWSLYAR